MAMFEDRDDVEDWLATLDYKAFWREAGLFKLELPATRASCDEQIASGAVDEALVLRVLKGFARLDLVDRYQLRARLPESMMRRH